MQSEYRTVVMTRRPGTEEDEPGSWRPRWPGDDGGRPAGRLGLLPFRP
jgi:hypothetical protein